MATDKELQIKEVSEKRDGFEVGSLLIDDGGFYCRVMFRSDEKDSITILDLETNLPETFRLSDAREMFSIPDETPSFWKQLIGASYILDKSAQILYEVIEEITEEVLLKGSIRVRIVQSELRRELSISVRDLMSDHHNFEAYKEFPDASTVRKSITSDVEEVVNPNFDPDGFGDGTFLATTPIGTNS